jgi:hypothetical protein
VTDPQFRPLGENCSTAFPWDNRPISDRRCTPLGRGPLVLSQWTCHTVPSAYHLMWYTKFRDLTFSGATPSTRRVTFVPRDTQCGGTYGSRHVGSLAESATNGHLRHDKDGRNPRKVSVFRCLMSNSGGWGETNVGHPRRLAAWK